MDKLALVVRHSGSGADCQALFGGLGEWLEAWVWWFAGWGLGVMRVFFLRGGVEGLDLRCIALKKNEAWGNKKADFSFL